VEHQLLQIRAVHSLLSVPYLQSLYSLSQLHPAAPLAASSGCPPAYGRHGPLLHGTSNCSGRVKASPGARRCQASMQECAMHALFSVVVRAALPPVALMHAAGTADLRTAVWQRSGRDASRAVRCTCQLAC
jgi:hypothetical protein